MQFGASFSARFSICRRRSTFFGDLSKTSQECGSDSSPFDGSLFITAGAQCTHGQGGQAESKLHLVFKFLDRFKSYQEIKLCNNGRIAATHPTLLMVPSFPYGMLAGTKSDEWPFNPTND